VSKDKIDDGGSVSPMYNLTLRDYFAAKAMQAIISNFRQINRSTSKGNTEEYVLDFIKPDFEGLVQRGDVIFCVTWHAYAIADAMLAARKEDK